MNSELVAQAACHCSHPYSEHRQERASQIATVCAKCRCVGFTPRNQRAWNRLLQRHEGK
jgi:hypothetical protein